VSKSKYKEIVFASKNRGKIREAKALLEETGIILSSLYDYLDTPEIIEDGRTFLENALKKARVISEYTGKTTIADDSGLEVDYLGGEPGIHSARYSGAGATDETNIQKLLEKLKGVPAEQRGAAFKCALVLYRTDGTYDSFEGKLEGTITAEKAGNEGFGYDPIFFLPEYDKTVAQIDPELKNRISHRAQAFAKLKKNLQEQAEYNK